MTPPLDSLAVTKAMREHLPLFHADPDRWWLYRRKMPPGTFARWLHPLQNREPVVLWLQPMLYGNMRISLGHERSQCFFSNYCYHEIPAAWWAAIAWDGEGEPEGWIRHLESGRRRPDGDPAREYVRP